MLNRAILLSIICVITGCRTAKRPGEPLVRSGDEIMVCGQLFHTGAPVVLWTDPGGFDAYRTERRFAPMEKSSFEATTQESKDIKNPARYNTRFATTQKVLGDGPLTADELEKVRGGGWDLPLLQRKVDQFVYHYDVCGTARQCFNILHDHRGLSVHFMLDVDGTIYQSLDLKDRAWHATTSNHRSIGIEIANIGAYSPKDEKGVLDQWYRKDESGKTRMVLPAWAKQEWIRTPNFVARPDRNDAVIGMIQGREYRMYDLTPQQYDSLIKLTAALCTVFPKINCDAPRDGNGKVTTVVLPQEQLEKYEGLMGHYHVQENKQDPGPAFQWERVINEARKLMAGRRVR